MKIERTVPVRRKVQTSEGWAKIQMTIRYPDGSRVKFAWREGTLKAKAFEAQMASGVFGTKKVEETAVVEGKDEG
jgi:hypothetical protein